MPLAKPGAMQTTNVNPDDRGVNKLLLGLILAVFLSLHVYAFYADGLIDGFMAVFHSMRGWNVVLGADLTISLFLIGGWLIRDARKRGVSPVPYIALTVATGSVGPLVYLLRNHRGK